ncbi:uncharacterized protein N7503_008783 [Penicillium pulvis]|uniref:uncharacterized protein n=1 Tax=Penicillium pulvis TaxID=1562058 RepID=UPI00254985AE|nr:uncharacterized protein N7503_008783 [Penicillium pulvis]KAJ5792805.1 hypothetical protein N7503_008783 [Penicillium pulvis]
MIRRPPSIISLGDEELQYHLHRIYLRSLSTDLDRLHLDDPDQKYDGDDLLDSSFADKSEEDTNIIQNREEVHGPPCVGTRSVPGVITTSPVEESALTESHQIVDTINVPAARLRSSLPSQNPRLIITGTALHDQGKSAIHPSGKEEYHLRKSLQAWSTTENDEHSRLPTVQVSRESPAAFPEMVSKTVPLRGLSLASTTRSDEAGLASSTASTAIAVDTQHKQDTSHYSTAEEPSTDRDCVC